jgi:hypothetical protein
MIADMILGDD